MMGKMEKAWLDPSLTFARLAVKNEKKPQPSTWVETEPTGSQVNVL